MIEIPPIILASASARRAMLMREANLRFEVRVSPVEEAEVKPREIPTELWPMALAYIKARAVQEKLRVKGVEPLIVGADTIVVLEGEIMNKAKDKGHARAMLKKLAGKRHEVITGVALLLGEKQRLTRAVSVCRVKKLTPGQLEEYLETDLWKGKAGAYGIQDGDDPWVKLESGEWSNVVGLPMGLLREEMQSMI